MVKQLAAIAILASVVSLAAVACGGGDDEEEPAPPPPPAAAAVPTGAPAAESVEARDLNAEAEAQATAIAQVAGPTGVTGHTGGATDFTIFLAEGTAIKQAGHWVGPAPFRFVPEELTFKVGETVNFTLKPPDQSRVLHYFVIQELGVNEAVKYGKPTTFTFTFDKPGTFRLFCQTHVTWGMIGTITVQ